MADARLEHVGVMDIDGTMMTKRMELEGATASELEAAEFVRAHFEARGYFTVATAQTAEMIMTSRTHEASVRAGFSRPRPLLGISDQGRFHIPPESIACRVPFLDPDVIMSMGTGGYFRQPDISFVENESLKALLKPRWRSDALRFIDLIRDETGADYRQYFAPIESEDNYRLGETDVMPLTYRIQFEFPDLATKNLMKDRVGMTLTGLRQLRKMHGITDDARAAIEDEYGSIIGNMLIVDESRPHLKRFQSYLIPHYGSKEEMIGAMLNLLSRGEMIGNLLIAGDMPPDLRAGAYAGWAKHATFLLVGGSPLSPYFDRKAEKFGKGYAGESFRFITDNLEPTNRPGFEILHRAGVPSRVFVFGDIAYPGTVGPETIQAFLKDSRKPDLY